MYTYYLSDDGDDDDDDVDDNDDDDDDDDDDEVDDEDDVIMVLVQTRATHSVAPFVSSSVTFCIFRATCGWHVGLWHDTRPKTTRGTTTHSPKLDTSYVYYVH